MGGMHVPYGMETLHVPYATCFKEKIRKPMFFSFEHLAYERNLSHIGATNEGGEELQCSPYQLLEDKQHFGGEDCNIPN